MRTSSGTFLNRRQDHTGTLEAVEDRLSQLSGIPTSHFEVCSNVHGLSPRDWFAGVRFGVRQLSVFAALLRWMVEDMSRHIMPQRWGAFNPYHSKLS